VTIQ
jgi:hypothetical protein